MSTLVKSGQDLCAPMVNKEVEGLDEPHIAVNATTRIPPAVGLVAVVYPDSNHIVALTVKIWRKVIAKTAVTVGSRASPVTAMRNNGTRIRSLLNIVLDLINCH